MADKRKSKRNIKRVPYKCCCGGVEFKGMSSNFSFTGLYIKTRKEIKPDASVDIVLELDENKKIPLKGVISRVKKASKFDTYKHAGIGIKLTTVPQEYLEFLETLYDEMS